MSQPVGPRGYDNPHTLSGEQKNDSDPKQNLIQSNLTIYDMYVLKQLIEKCNQRDFFNMEEKMVMDMVRGKLASLLQRADFFGKN